MDASHSVAWHANGGMIAFDRSDTMRRQAISNLGGGAPYVNLVRSRVTGDVATADIIGALRFIRRNGSTELVTGQLFSQKTSAGADSARTVLSARRTDGVEISVIIGENGQESLDPNTPNTMALGGVYAWSGIRSQTSVVVTSDAREKTGFSALPPALAVELRAIPIGRFQLNSAIEAKGADGARIHVGVLAQDVEAAFRRAGEDPERWAVFCSDPWLEEIDEEYEDGDGVTKTRKAWRQVEDNGVPRRRLGVRYEQLLILLAAAERERVDALAAEVQALRKPSN